MESPFSKKIKVVSLITLSEDELKELSDYKGFEGVLKNYVMSRITVLLHLVKTMEHA